MILVNWPIFNFSVLIYWFTEKWKTTDTWRENGLFYKGLCPSSIWKKKWVSTRKLRQRYSLRGKWGRPGLRNWAVQWRGKWQDCSYRLGTRNEPEYRARKYVYHRPVSVPYLCTSCLSYWTRMAVEPKVPLRTWGNQIYLVRNQARVVSCNGCPFKKPQAMREKSDYGWDKSFRFLACMEFITHDRKF